MDGLGNRAESAGSGGISASDSQSMVIDNNATKTLKQQGSEQ